MVVVIKMGAYIHGLLILCGCLFCVGAYYHGMILDGDIPGSQSQGHPRISTMWDYRSVAMLPEGVSQEVQGTFQDISNLGLQGMPMLPEGTFWGNVGKIDKLLVYGILCATM